jgi:thiol-disulfide isomerase/thioredoxin
MKSLQKWTLPLSVATAFVAGYASAVMITAAELRRSVDAHHVAQHHRAPEVVPAHEIGPFLGKSLPPARLLGPEDVPLADATLRRGKVVLVLLSTECGACLAEAEFLRSVVTTRRDVKFVGVLSFEQDEETLRKAQTLFAFPVVRDDRMELMRRLGLSRVPIKIYLDHGVVKESWAGASLTEDSKNRFRNWLRDV